MEKSKEIKMLLNHDYSREIGSTAKNLRLMEDNIGLRAIAEVSDEEVIEKARSGKLRGWSFGFIEERAREEDAASGMKRRFVEEMDLREVSLIDERKVPCYAGTSITMRADGDEVLETRVLETEPILHEEKEINYDKYKNRIKELGGK